MKAVFARGSQTTDFFSDNFFYVNNCGYYNNIDIGFQVSRTDGRQDYQFIFISQGSMEVLSNGGYIPVHAGGAVLFRPGEPQCYRISENSGTSYYWLHFSGFYAKEILNQAGIVENIFYSKGLSDLKQLFRELVGAIRSGGSDLFTAGLAISLLSSVSIKPQNMFAWIIDQMNNDIDCGIFDRDYALSAHMSKYHFIRSFSGACGKTPHAYFLWLRMDRAKLLLSDTSAKIGEIAELLGYEDSFYFSNVFKKHTGLSPRSYRAKYRQ